jgi:DNA-binding MarR family transcriptional regulator
MRKEQKYEKLLLKNQLCYPVYLCAKEITRKYAPVLRELDLTYTQYIVMMYFWEEKESNVRDLGRALVLDPSTLTPLLKKLEQKGYIDRVRSKSDERNLSVKITKKGLKLRDAALDVPEKMGKCLNLSHKEAKTLYNLMHKVIANIERE